MNLKSKEHGALFRAASKGLDALTTYEGKDNQGDDVFAVPSATRDMRHLVRVRLGKKGEPPTVLSCTCESWTNQVERDPDTARCTHAAAVTLYLAHGKVTIKPLPYVRQPSFKDRDWTKDPVHHEATTPKRVALL